jgi:leucyl/phenylalanyl-tRNA--protein transferase
VTVYRIPEDEFIFPDPRRADESGLLGVGGDLRPERLLLGYASGIFPWYSDDQPILWFSPDPRFALDPAHLHLGRSIKRTLKKTALRVTMDTAFEAVISACKTTPRPGQKGTWITADMFAAYCELHHLGYAHSVEVWSGETLVGGLYGVSLGGLFSGESMFSHVSDASKIGLVWLIGQLQEWGFGLVDAQVHTDTLARFGAVELCRDEYLRTISELVKRPSRVGLWSFDEGFDPIL